MVGRVPTGACKDAALKGLSANLSGDWSHGVVLAQLSENLPDFRTGRYAQSSKRIQEGPPISLFLVHRGASGEIFHNGRYAPNGGSSKPLLEIIAVTCEQSSGFWQVFFFDVLVAHKPN